LRTFAARLAPLFVFACLVGAANAQQTSPTPNLNLGDAVVTGFSGTIAPAPGKPGAATFIDPNGASARIFDAGKPGYVWDGRLFAAPKKFDVLAKDVGQVFGVALDDAEQPNIYVAATSAFGLNIVKRGRDGSPERTKKGGPGAGWMQGQFGLDLQGGPGAIYKIDGRSGVVTLFANVTLDGVPNPGPGLGNLAYDAAHKQLFASDLYSGMIHRFDLDGKELSRYDHGVTGLGAAKLPTVAFNPKNRPNIASDRFDSEKPDTWGFAPAPRRVWGLAVQEGRLYYSVMSGPQIWSVGLSRDGDFVDNPRWELDVPAQAGPLPISDIAFTHQGAMILAQRALIGGAYDYGAFTRPGEPQVFRVWLKGPNDPPSPGRWKLTLEEYAIGFAGNNRNTNGGVALGYGYDATGALSTTVCEAALWTTGQNLRNDPARKSQLEPAGPLVVHGLQGAPANQVRNANTPPATSYMIDYDNSFDDPGASGHMGSVRIYTKPCPSYFPLVSTVAANAAGVGGGGGGGGGPPSPPNACVVPPNIPVSQSLPPCTQPGQAATLDLSTVTHTSTPTADPNWTVTPFGPHAYSTYFSPVWNVLPNNWVQPSQSAAIVPLAIGPYTYTRTFNLVCRPESYRKLEITGLLASDNSAVMTLNGPSNIIPPGCPVGLNFCYHSPPTSAGGVPFTHTGPSFFVQGLNSLTVTVTNAPPGGPTGLSVIAKLEGICGDDCDCKSIGTVVVEKKVINKTRASTATINALTFPINLTCGLPASINTTFGLNNNGSHTENNVPYTSLCTVTESTSTLPPVPPNACPQGSVAVWATPVITPASATINAPITVFTVVNELKCTDKPTVIDLKIEKTGGTTPACLVNAYDFTIKVTNAGAAWPGSGSIVVSDTVPANMTFAPIVSPPWSCLPAGVLSAGTAFQCTYNGPAPTANQTLPSISISATSNIGPPFPPFTNCASVASTNASYADSNSSNNNSCTTVSKPSSCTCPAGQVLNVDGICSCPDGQVMIGGACVPAPVCTAPQVLQPDGTCGCPAPMTPGAIPGQCLCPAPNVMVGGACVPPPPPTCTPPQVLGPDNICICPPPMTPGAVLGQCLCSAPNVMVGGACVPPLPPTCTPPQMLGPDNTCVCPAPNVMAGGKCVARKTDEKRTDEKKTKKKPELCPEGTHRAGRKCVKNESKEPRINSGDVMRGIGIGIGGGRRGGPTGGGGNPGGGGQGHLKR